MDDYTPTLRFRWARRTIRPNATVDHEHALEVLQQMYERTPESDLHRTEWRDVPTENE